jgi:hypothetical protein
MRAEKFHDMVKEKKTAWRFTRLCELPRGVCRISEGGLCQEEFLPRSIFGLVKALPDAEMKKLF